MDVNPLSLKDGDSEGYFVDLPSANILRATLAFTAATPEAKKARLVNDMIFIREWIPDWTWLIIFEVASDLRPENPLHDELIQGILCIKQQGTVIRDRRGEFDWFDHGELRMNIREDWDSRAGPSPDKGLSEEEVERFHEVSRAKWVNFNSFLARLRSAGVETGICFPIWQCREALEKRRTIGPGWRSDIVAATEWIIRCAGILFDSMNLEGELDEHQSRAFRTGDLNKSQPAFSRARWDFWKQRFSDLAADAAQLDLDDTTVARLSEARRCMDVVDSSTKPTEQADKESADALPSELERGLANEGDSTDRIDRE